MATQNLQDLPLWTTELQRLEEAVNKSDGDGVRARWESGRYLRSLRDGQRFRRGERANLAESIGVHRSELTARIKFAGKFPTEDDLTTAISQFRSWYAIKQHGLTDRPRTVAKPNELTAEHARGSAGLRRVRRQIEEMDPATFGEEADDELASIEELVGRLRQALVVLQAA